MAQVQVGSHADNWAKFSPPALSALHEGAGQSPGGLCIGACQKARLHAGGHSLHKAVNGLLAGSLAHYANAQHLSGQRAKAASHFNLVFGA